MTLMPSENWPPYRALWSRFPGRPWTHVMRDNPRFVLPAAAAILGVLLVWQARAHWRLLLALALGFLLGHVYW